MQQKLEDMQARAASCLSWDGVEQKKIDWGAMPFPVGACVQITWLEDGSSSKEDRFRPRQIAHVLAIDQASQTVSCRVEGSTTERTFEREGLKKFKLAQDGTGAYIKEFDMQEPPLTIIMENNLLKLHKQIIQKKKFVFQWTSFTEDKRFGVVVDETIMADPFVTAVEDVLVALEHGIEHGLLFADEEELADELLNFFSKDIAIEQKLVSDVEAAKAILNKLFIALTFSVKEDYDHAWIKKHGLHGAKLKQIYNAHAQRLIHNLIYKAPQGRKPGLLNSKSFEAYQRHMQDVLARTPPPKTPVPSEETGIEDLTDSIVRIYKPREARFISVDAADLQDDDDDDDDDAHKYDEPMVQVCWHTPVEASGIPLFLFTEHILEKDLDTKNYTVGPWSAPDQHTPQFYMGDCLDYGGKEYIPTCLDLPRLLCAGSDKTLGSQWRQSELDAGEEVRFPSVYMTRERPMTMVPWLSTNPGSLLLLKTIPKTLRKLLTAAADVFVASSTEAQQVTDAIWNALEQKKKTTVSARHKPTVEDFVEFLKGLGTQNMSSTKREFKGLLETAGDGAQELRDEIRKRVPPAVLEDIQQMFVVKDKVTFQKSHKKLAFDPVFGILMFLHEELLAEFWEDYEHDDGEASDDDGEDGANMVVDDQWNDLDELNMHPILRHQKRHQDAMQKKHGGGDVDMQAVVATTDVIADDFTVSDDDNAEATACATLIHSLTAAGSSLVLVDDRHGTSFSPLFMQRMGVLGQHRAGVSLPSPQNATGLDSEHVLRGLLCFLANVSPKMLAQDEGEVVFQCLLALCAQAMEILLRTPTPSLLWDVWQACLKLCCSSYLREVETEGGTEERALYYLGEGFFDEVDDGHTLEALRKHTQGFHKARAAIRDVEANIIKEIEDKVAERQTIKDQIGNMPLGLDGRPLFSVRIQLYEELQKYDTIIDKLQTQKRAEESKLAEYSMPELQDAAVRTWVHQDPSTSSARQTALQKKLAGGPLDRPFQSSQNPFFDDTLTLRLRQPEVTAATPEKAEYERLMHMLRVRLERSLYHPPKTALLWDLTDDATNDATHSLVLLYVDHVFRRQATNVTDMHAVTETYFFTHEKFANQLAIEQCQRVMRERLKDAALYFAHKDRDIIQWVQGDDEVAFLDELQQRATAAPVNSRTEQGVRIVREKDDRSSSTEVLRVDTPAKLTSVAVARFQGKHVVAVGDSAGTVHFLSLDGTHAASVRMAANSRVLSVNFDAGATSLAVVCADAVDDDARIQGVTDSDSITVTHLTAPQGWLVQGSVEKGTVERGRDHEYTQELTAAGVMKPQGAARISHASFALSGPRVYKPVAKPYSQFWTNSAVQDDASSDLAQVRRQTEVEMWRKGLLHVAQGVLFGDEPDSMQGMTTRQVAQRIHEKTGYDVFLLHSAREKSALGTFLFDNVVAGRPSSKEVGERTIFGGVVQVASTGLESVVCITSEMSDVDRDRAVMEEEDDGDDKDYQVTDEKAVEVQGDKGMDIDSDKDNKQGGGANHEGKTQGGDEVGVSDSESESSDSSESDDDDSDTTADDPDTAAGDPDTAADNIDAMQEARSVVQSRFEARSYEAYCGDCDAAPSMYPVGYVPVQPLYYQVPPPNTAPGQGYYVPVPRRSWW